MASFFITLIYFIILICIGLRVNWKRGLKREFWVSAVFLCAAFIILSLASFNIYAPSPILMLQRAIKTIFHIKQLG